MKRTKQAIKSHRKLLIFWCIFLLLWASSRELIAAILNSGTIALLLVVGIVVLSVGAVPICLVISIIRKRYRIVLLSLINLLAIAVLLLVGDYFPEAQVTNVIRGKPKLIAMYEGTQNRAKLTLRENDKFDILWLGVFFSSAYSKGTYTNEDDIYVLHFESDVPRNLNGEAEKIHETFGTYFRCYRYDDNGQTRSLDFLIIEPFVGQDP